MIDRRAFLRSALSALLAAAWAPHSSASPKIRLAIVVAKASPISDLSGHELRRLYLGLQTTGPGGTRLIPLNQGARLPDRVGFDRVVLDMSPDEVGRYWIDRKIRGLPGAPKSIDSADLLQRVVARMEGAIGYVRAGDVRPDVKLVRIDGKLPGDPGYRVEF